MSKESKALITDEKKSSLLEVAAEMYGKDTFFIEEFLDECNYDIFNLEEGVISD